jgi:signal transduction histidine kinase
MIIAQVDKNSNVNDVVEKVEKDLRKLKGQEEGKENFFVQTYDEILEQLENFIASKKLSVKKTYTAEPVWNIDPDLAHILLSNLLSNAVRHNVDDGDIQIRLKEHELQISNSGRASSLPAEKMFERFQTGSETGSTGLGLAIVKEIGTVTNMKVTYNYSGNRHILTIRF